MLAYGYIVRRLLDKGIHAMGIDVSKWCEKQAQKIIPGHFIRHDMTKRLPFRNKEFDVVYCEGVLEHIDPYSIADVMREFDRVSKYRIIQTSFSTHKNVSETDGHICIRPMEWWFAMIPEQTWLFLDESGTDGGNQWLYKG